MIVRVYNFLSEEKPKFSQNLVGIVSDVTSFKYTRRAYDIGSFEMVIPTHADETDCIQPDRMLIVGDKIQQTYIESDHTKRIVIGTFLYVTDVEKKDDTITVTGYDLKYLFALRVTLFPKEEQDKGTYGYYVTSGTTFSCISDIINYNIVNATDSDRKIYGMFGITMPVDQINAEPPLTGIQDDRYMTRLEPVSTAIFNLLKNCKTHFYDMRLIIDDNAEDGDNYNPHMESSEDKPTIIIDESRYNIKSYARKDGTSAYKNAIYAVVGSGDAVTVKCVKRPDDTASGVKRKEVVLDVDTDSVSEIDRYALKAAEEYVISDDFEIEPLFMDDEAEPELAQKVSIRIDGIEYNTVITEITDEYANGKHSQSYVCGDKKLKVLNVLNKATAGNTQKIVNNKIAMGNKTGVGVFVDYDRTSEIFNDYNHNTAYGNYSHVEGYKNRMDSEGAILSWATHIEGEQNKEESQTSCPSDKKASNNHIEGKLNSSYGRINHVEGGNCYAEYDTQCCHVEGSNSRVSEGARVAHVEGKDCVAGGNCTHAQNLGTIAEKDNCTALGKYNKDFDYAVMIGGGSSDTDRKNILTVEWDGTVRNTGSVYTDGDVMGKNGVFDGNLSVLGNVNFYGKTNFKVPIATRNAVGGIKIGNNLSIAADGTLSAEAQPDIASASKAGIVKVGENIDVTADGTISIPAPCTLRIDNKASANLVHKYVPVATSEEKIYYGDIGNSIVCNGYTFWGSGMTIASPGVFLDFSPTLMVEKFAKTASGEIIEDCDFQVALVNVDSKAFKSYRLESKKAELTTTSVYKNYSVQFDPIIFPTWKSIIAPTNNHPYGRLQVTLSLMYVNSSNKVATGNSISGYIDFATEAEYNAAVCLTHSSVRTTRMEERTNAFIIPSSLSLVTDALPETGEEDVLYLIYDEDTAPAMKEYLWHNNAWVYLGETDHKCTAKEIGAATAADITAAVNAISIGGRNIATGTADMVIGKINQATWANGQWRTSGTGTVETIEIADAPCKIHKGVRLIQTTGSNQIGIVQDKVLVSSNTVYTLSCWARSNSADGVTCRLQPFFKNSTDTGGAADIVVKNEWQKISYTTVRAPLTTEEYSCAYIYLQPTEIGNYIDICGIKLETGNKATDWSPAPEDTAADITALSSKQSTLEQTVSEQIAEIAVGGRNIVTGTAELKTGNYKSATWNNGQWRKSGTGTIITVSVTDPPQSGITKGIRCTATDAQTQVGIAQDEVLLMAKAKYTLSCWVRGTPGAKASLQLYQNQQTTTDTSGSVRFDLTAEWQRIMFTPTKTPQTTMKYSVAYVIVQPNNIENAYVEICGIKLETGNKPTDWSPAPEDDERRITALEARVAALEAAAVSGGEV